MSRIALIVASSDKCIPLLQQCVVSYDIAVSKSIQKHECVVFVYECNWHPQSVRREEYITRWIDTINIATELPLKCASIVQLNAESIILKHTILPDIAVYDDFARHHMDDFDYAIFCHNDIQFLGTPFLDAAISIVGRREICLIAEPTIRCAEYLTIRYRPHFIFVYVPKFRQGNLSFANEYKFPDEFNILDPVRDGGAGLLLSQYHQNNPTDYRATNWIPRRWLRHLKPDFASFGQGIETYNIHHPNTPEFDLIMQASQKYVDSYLYGQEPQ